MPTLRGNLPFSQQSEKRPQSERNLTHKAGDLKRYPQEHLVYPHIIHIIIHNIFADMLLPMQGPHSARIILLSCAANTFAAASPMPLDAPVMTIPLPMSFYPENS